MSWNWRCPAWVCCATDWVNRNLLTGGRRSGPIPSCRSSLKLERDRQVIEMPARGYQVRRIVTGLNAQRESEISLIGPCTNRIEAQGWPGTFVNELWVTNESPVDNSGSQDAALRPIRHDPTPGGTIFRIVEIPPENNLKVDAAATFAAMGSANRPTDKDKSRHFSMHKTDSI